MRQVGDDLPKSNTHLRIPGTGVDYPVYFDRIPCIGERITGPDDFGIAIVKEIDWRFEEGFSFPPLPFVVARHQG